MPLTFLSMKQKGLTLPYPDWRDNPMMVHQLKQDTIWACATGKINPGLFVEYQSVPFFNVFLGILTMFEPLIVKKYKMKIFPKKSNTFMRLTK